jgi:hypothetical protein
VGVGVGNDYWASYRFGRIGKGGTIKGGVRKGWVDGRKDMGLLSFVALVCVWYIPVVVVEGACVRDCRGLGLCIVGTVA